MHRVSDYRTLTPNQHLLDDMYWPHSPSVCIALSRKTLDAFHAQSLEPPFSVIVNNFYRPKAASCFRGGASFLQTVATGEGAPIESAPHRFRNQEPWKVCSPADHELAMGFVDLAWSGFEVRPQPDHVQLNRVPCWEKTVFNPAPETHVFDDVYPDTYDNEPREFLFRAQETRIKW